MFRFRLRPRPRKIDIHPGSGPEGRITRLRQLVSGLIRYERIEPSYPHADEARQYAERLIYLAIKNGDQHKATMEQADFWLLEKDLVHKLFKVLVPRFQHSKSSYTELHKQAVEYPGTGQTMAVLQLKGNPWPPVVPRQRDTKHLLTNVLLTAARHDYHEKKRQRALKSEETAELPSDESISSPESVPTTSPSEFSSSVDPPSSSKTR